MLLWKRPPAPSAFEAKAKPLRRLVRWQMLRGRQPAFNEKKHEIWQAFVVELETTQHGKCAYCDDNAEATSFGHVEHFRPKNSVSQLPDDRTRWGYEVLGTSRVRGRQLDRISETGYHWLAYSWTNYFYACFRCNTQWKRDLFPVADNPRRLPPHPSASEKPLLLDPCGNTDPVEHLRFTRTGAIEPFRQSLLGRQTIDTMGLDRRSLQSSRSGKARFTYRLVARAKDAVRQQRLGRQREALEDLHILGDAGDAHAGMVRCIVYQELGLTWTELETAIQD